MPLVGSLDVLPANLLLLAVAAVRIHHHQGPRATTRRGLVTASRRVTRYGQLAIERNPKKVALTSNRWGAPGRLIWLVSRAVGGGAID